MKQYYLLSIAALFLFSGTLVAQWNNQYPNPSLPILENSDPKTYHTLKAIFDGKDEKDLIPEYKLLNINMLSEVKEGPIDITLHLGAKEAADPNEFIFEQDRTEKLVVHITPFSLGWLPNHFTENYRIDCLENGQTLFADSGNEVGDEGVDASGFPLVTTLEGHFKFNGYDYDINSISLNGPEGNTTNQSVQDVVRSSFYQVWPVSLGTETLTFSVKQMTKLKKGFATFKEIRRFQVRIHAVPPVVPTGSNDEDQPSSSRLP